MGAGALLVRTDVSVPEKAEALVRQVEDEYGRIDALINCVGSYRRIHLMQESVEGWHSMFDNNLHPVFYLTRAAAPGMIQRKRGRIVNFSMVNADQLVGQPYITAHYIAKIGVLVLPALWPGYLPHMGSRPIQFLPDSWRRGACPKKNSRAHFRISPPDIWARRTTRWAPSSICFPMRLVTSTEPTSI